MGAKRLKEREIKYKDLSETKKQTHTHTKKSFQPASPTELCNAAKLKCIFNL